MFYKNKKKKKKKSETILAPRVAGYDLRQAFPSFSLYNGVNAAICNSQKAPTRKKTPPRPPPFKRDNAERERERLGGGREREINVSLLCFMTFCPVDYFKNKRRRENWVGRLIIEESTSKQTNKQTRSGWGGKS